MTEDKKGTHEKLKEGGDAKAQGRKGGVA
jgi:hypothetical protein